VIRNAASHYTATDNDNLRLIWEINCHVASGMLQIVDPIEVGFINPFSPG